jgi:hypothetical protein
LQGLQPTAATLTFSIVSGPSSGQVGSVGTATCSNGVCTADVDYTPGSDFFGSDSFTFRANNGTSFSNTSTVNITVNNVQDAPDAVDDTPAAIAEDSGPNVINVLSNDTDIDNDTLTVSAVTQGSHGSVTNNGSSVSYTPNSNFFGTDTFTYTISDGNGGTDTATVNVHRQQRFKTLRMQLTTRRPRLQRTVVPTSSMFSAMTRMSTTTR